MTDAELAAAAWLELTHTTGTYANWVKRGSSPLAPWGKAKAYLDQIVGGVEPPPPPPPAPSPAGTLKYRPPGWDGVGDPRNPASFPGFKTIVPTAVGTGFEIAPADGGDYYVKMGRLAWSSIASGRSSFHIRGSYNRVVIIGGEVAFTGTNNTDDACGLLVDGGTASSHIYVEGVKMDCANGPTWRSPAKGTFQMCRFEAHAYNDDASHIHADCFQIWDGGADQAELFFDRVTGYTHFTGLSALLSQPKRWRRDRTDLHFGKRVTDTQQMGNYMVYFSPGNNPITCFYDGGANNWLDLGYWGGIREQLQMALDSPSYSPHLTYVVNHAGTDYGPTNDPNFFRGANVSVGATQGDEWRCTSVPNLSERWKWGKPTTSDGATNGEFVPADTVGVNYVSPGYL